MGKISDLFRGGFAEELCLSVADKQVVFLDFVGSSYLRGVRFTTSKKQQISLKEFLPGASVITLPPCFCIRQTTLSGWGLLKNISSFLRRCPRLANEGNLTVRKAFEVLGKDHHMPDLVVVVAGLNDLLMLYRQNRNSVPRNADGSLTGGEILDRMIGGLNALRESYGDPFPRILWCGFGRVSKNYSPELNKWMNDLEKFFTTRVGGMNWPSWLYYGPLVRGVLKKESDFQGDGIHWTLDAAERFGDLIVKPTLARLFRGYLDRRQQMNRGPHSSLASSLNAAERAAENRPEIVEVQIPQSEAAAPWSLEMLGNSSR